MYPTTIREKGARFEVNINFKRAKANALLQDARAKRDAAGETYAEYMKAYEKSREEHVTTLKDQLTRLLTLMGEVREVGEQIRDNVNTALNCFSPKEGVLQEVGSCIKVVKLIVNEVNTLLHPQEVLAPGVSSP